MWITKITEIWTEKKLGHLKAYSMSVVIINRANKIDFAFCGNLVGFYNPVTCTYACIKFRSIRCHTPVPFQFSYFYKLKFPIAYFI